MANLDVLRGPRVSLREITAENIKDYPSPHEGDYKAFTALWGKPARPLQKQAASKFALADDSMGFTIHQIGSGDHLGAADVSNIDLLGRSATVGIYILPDQRGKGYATDAVRLACSYALDHLGLHRLAFKAFSSNKSSLALARRCGFVEEARLRKAKWTVDGWVDQIEFGMLDEEWAQIKRAFPSQ